MRKAEHVGDEEDWVGLAAGRISEQTDRVRGGLSHHRSDSSQTGMDHAGRLLLLQSGVRLWLTLLLSTRLALERCLDGESDSSLTARRGCSGHGSVPISALPRFPQP